MKPALLALCPLLMVGCAMTEAPTKGRTMADEKLSADLASMLSRIETAYATTAQDAPGARGASASRGAKISNRKVNTFPDARGIWTEDWTVVRDGGHAVYTVAFVPAHGGNGADFTIKTPPRLDP